MKKLLSFLLTLSLVFGLLGCAPTIGTTLQTETTEVTQSPPPETTDSVPETTEADKIVPTETKPVQTDPPETRPLQTDPPVQTDPPEITAPPQTQPPETTVPETEPEETTVPETEPSGYLDTNGSYTSKEDVALYIHLYGRLPGNFITKAQARTYGWKKGALERYAPGKCIGGDVFRNQEGQLPAGHSYFECDIDTLGSYSGRGSKRIVYSSDGLVYYTGDHYRTFELLYGEP